MENDTTLERLFDVKLENIKLHISFLEERIKLIDGRITSLIANLKWLIVVVMPIVTIVVTAVVNKVMA